MKGRARIIVAPPDSGLLPRSRLSGPMPWVVAIMIFLTTLACAAGIALGEGAANMAAAASDRLTVQLSEPEAAVRNALARRMRDRLAALPGVTTAVVVPHDQLVAQLVPWLGEDLAEAGDIPVPALIDADLSVSGAAAEALRSRIAREVAVIAPDARVEPHARYLGPVVRLVRTVGWIALAVVALMAVATACVVGLAARGAHAAHRATIDVLHMLGATDAQVIRLFQRRMIRDTGFGAAIGFAAACLIILLVGRSVALLAGDLMGGIALPGWGWAVLVLLPVLFVLLAWAAARRTLRKALDRSL